MSFHHAGGGGRLCAANVGQVDVSWRTVEAAHSRPLLCYVWFAHDTFVPQAAWSLALGDDAWAVSLPSLQGPVPEASPVSCREGTLRDSGGQTRSPSQERRAGGRGQASDSWAPARPPRCPRAHCTCVRAAVREAGTSSRCTPTPAAGAPRSAARVQTPGSRACGEQSGAVTRGAPHTYAPCSQSSRSSPDS